MKITYPDPPTDDIRVSIAESIALYLRHEWPDGDRVGMGETTSGCPVVRMEFGGKKYNITITRARK